MQSSSASTSPTSPFTTNSIQSDPTSDELPDLGEFTAVFRQVRAWNQQPLPRAHRPQLSSSATSSSMELESSEVSLVPTPDGSTVWSRRPIASYLNSVSTIDIDTHSSSPGSGSNTEGDTHTLELDLVDPVDYELSDVELDTQPSLGLLDGALSFLAAERARWTAQREAGTAVNEATWKHVVEPRRKRRRKRRSAKPDDNSQMEITEDVDSSSSFDYTTTTTTTTHKSVPSTPARSRKDKRRQQALATTSGSPTRVLIHSKSTPQLRPIALLDETHPRHARVIRLRSLAKKLGKLFPADEPLLNSIISDDFGQDDVDPRGLPPGENDALIHVFIDHSNILIGLLSHLKRNPRVLNSTPSNAGQTLVATPAPNAAFTFPLKSGQRLRHLSHSALALILERGRPISRRVLVTSSPLYQSMAVAESLGYEVRIYARVPDLGDGADRSGLVNPRPGHHGRSLSAGTGVIGSTNLMASNAVDEGKRRKGHVRRTSGSNSTESEYTHGFPQAFIRSLGLGESSASLPTTTSLPSPSTGTPTKIRYREQGVDELLQLKLHQALAAIDGPPPSGSTIVLATGDGNVGQFNEDGFLGPVRTALKKGWVVELYAWEEGLSRAWMREFGEWAKPRIEEGETLGRFRIVALEQFAAELLEIY
ncbi:hypothetical protein MIND_01053600 [Mycena indigotica]|uniref:Uncharacterized protein n=1 Tax=Mycena indigotica TaxID=2126181 RepID=A0A8H6SC62_9AGAR|nr:uncharacterized protein MIND_01053600 [Mycena indigotica]KAF7295150.1 hypothetical protein MIND_01053600 [Mycena indigotica]